MDVKQRVSAGNGIGETKTNVEKRRADGERKAKKKKGYFKYGEGGEAQ